MPLPDEKERLREQRLAEWRLHISTLQGEWMVCDRCQLKHEADDYPNVQHFISDHIEHNFTGLRIVKKNNPCPNRARNYAEVRV